MQMFRVFVSILNTDVLKYFTVLAILITNDKVGQYYLISPF